MTQRNGVMTIITIITDAIILEHYVCVSFSFSVYFVDGDSFYISTS